MLAARVPGKAGDAWSFCLANRATAPRTVALAVPSAGKVTLDRYVYARDSAQADKDGFPVPKDQVEADLEKGTEVSLPSEGVVFLTSMKRE